jgi:hypothetical protein
MFESLSQERFKEQIEKLRKSEQEYLRKMGEAREGLNVTQRALYDYQQRLLHVQEIYRLASQQFPRLRREQIGTLNAADRAELEKWIGRAKSNDGLLSIIRALEELGKYFPTDMKSNLYGLVQKIIIEGPYNLGKVHRR